MIKDPSHDLSDDIIHMTFLGDDGYTATQPALSKPRSTQSSSQFGFGPGGFGPPACLATII